MGEKDSPDILIPLIFDSPYIWIRFTLSSEIFSLKVQGTYFKFTLISWSEINFVSIQNQQVPKTHSILF
jgi:hypothetical protein